MNDLDVIHIWINDDEMDLCKYCLDTCQMGDVCKDFRWNGVMPTETDVI